MINWIFDAIEPLKIVEKERGALEDGRRVVAVVDA